ncbi:MAG: DMT family transporter [Calditrichaceae bacterium]|jgi:putative membrane protein PagO
MNIRNNKYLPFLIITILSLIWGSTWVAIKIGLEDLPPFLSAGWRFLVASVFLFGYSIKAKLPFPKDLHSHIFLLTFSVINFTVSYALVYWGEQYINSGLTSILFSVMPFYTAIISIKILPSEQITMKKMAGIIIGFLGVVLIFSDQLYFTHPFSLYGMIAVLLSPAFSAWGTLLGKKARTSYHAITLNTLPVFYTGLSFMLIHLLFEHHVDFEYTTSSVLSMAYLGIMGTAVAFALYFWLLKSVSAVTMSLITYITPPMALLWGWIIYDETITLRLILGMLVIFSGIAIVRRWK